MRLLSGSLFRHTAPRCLALLLVLAAAPVRAADLYVYAASSLGDVLTDLGASWAQETGHTVVPVLGGSSALARQIIAGAPADVFLPASPDWMEAVEAEGRIVPGSRRTIAGNTLVLVSTGAQAPALDLTDPAALRARLGNGRLAMALVDAVPAGQYGKAALTALGLWDGVADQVAQANNVRAALALVATGAAPLGVVYATDARAEPGVSVVAVFPDGSHPPILYPAAAVSGGQTDLALSFLDHLTNAEAVQTLSAYGFAAVAR